MSTSSASAAGKRPRWRIWLQALAVWFVIVLVLYVVGYFIVMDRHLPTSSSRNDQLYFESSYRWAPKHRLNKGAGPETPWPAATGWNDIYRPLDRIYFRLFPRSDAEIERLRQL
jgi:hypothetical protein